MMERPMESPSLTNVKHYVRQLERSDTSSSFRLAMWRAIRDAAWNGHDEELRKVEDLKSVVADSLTDVPIAS